MRFALSAFLLLLLALTALAGSGCKRHLPTGMAAPQVSFAKMSHVATPHPWLGENKAAAASHPTFVLCHPRSDALNDAEVSAAEAQVAFDLQATNDDRTEMIAADFERPDVPGLPHGTSTARRHASADVWLAVPLRPPRAA